FEDLHHMRSKLTMPPVLEPEILPGYQTATRIDRTERANRPVWKEGLDYRGVENASKDVEDIIEWQRNIKAVKEVTKFETGAPDGYHYKGNIEHGPLINIKVDQNSKIVDWRKVEVHAFQSSKQDEASISDSEEREEVENFKRKVQDKVDKEKNTV
ncbi:hypothetical protein TrRE_jg4061, partial [Triparma retinervis]